MNQEAAARHWDNAMSGCPLRGNSWLWYKSLTKDDKDRPGKHSCHYSKWFAAFTQRLGKLRERLQTLLSRNAKKPQKKKYTRGLELSKSLLHLLEGWIHLLLHQHPVASQRSGASLQVLHRAVDVGSWGAQIDVLKRGTTRSKCQCVWPINESTNDYN